MKKYLSGLVTGIALTLLVSGLAISALAASGNVSFNLSAIKFNGEVISEAGEGYTLSNGCVAPASITYTDEKGGGTTYLPARRVSELLGVDIGWDSASGAVTIGETPDTTAPSADYSDWSAEDEAAYQKFKGMWEVKEVSRRIVKTNGELIVAYDASLLGNKDNRTAAQELKAMAGDVGIQEFQIRFAQEHIGPEDAAKFYFVNREKPDAIYTNILDSVVFPIGNMSFGLE